MSIETRIQQRTTDERGTLERNKDLARQLIDRIFVRQEDGAIDELVADDFVPHTFGPMAPGREGLREGMRRAGAGISEPTFEVNDMVAEGDRVAVRVTTSGRHTGTFMGIEPSGNRYSIDEIHIFRLRDGQLIEHWHAFDTMDLIRQLRGDADGQAPGAASSAATGAASAATGAASSSPSAGGSEAAPGERHATEPEVELGFSPDRPSPEEPPLA